MWKSIKQGHQNFIKLQRIIQLTLPTKETMYIIYVFFDDNW